MSMRVDRNSLPGLYSSLSKEANTPQKPQDAAGQRLDKIELSSEGRKMRDVSAAQSQVKTEMNAEMAAEKLQEIREKVQSGTYFIPAHNIAQAMMQGISGDE